MRARFQMVLWTFALIFLMTAAANAQGELSKEEESRITKVLEPWGTWGSYRTTPPTDTDELNLTYRKDPQPTASDMPADIRDRVAHAMLYYKHSDADIDRFFDTFPKIKTIMVAKSAWTSRIGIKAAELKGIEGLWVQECDLAPEDMKSIGKMETLEILMLSGNKRVGPALDSLSDLTQLRQLSLANVPVPEFKKIRWLANNVNLTALWLNGTGIGDEAVPTLKALPNLTLAIVDDKTSAQGQAELQKSRQKRSGEK